MASEAEMIAEADEEIAAGLFVEEAEVDAWIDSLGTKHELPVPQAHR
jgi:predicted transcriptional regulator